MSTARLTVVALVCMFAGAALSLAVAHGTGPYGFEDPAITWLGRPSALEEWGKWSNLLGNPVVAVVVVASLAFGVARGAAIRVVLFVVLALAAFLINEHIAKPLVGRTYDGALTFPSGHVTAACATAFAMWLALFPLLKKEARHRDSAAGLGLGRADVARRRRGALAHATRRCRVGNPLGRHRRCRRRRSGAALGSTGDQHQWRAADDGEQTRQASRWCRGSVRRN